MYNIDVYDFDGTIYNGDSSLDFLIYALNRGKNIKYIPKILLYFILKVLGIISTKRFKEVCFSFIKDMDNLDEFVKEFWNEHDKKINNFFKENIKSGKKVYVISASPEFLLKPYISKFKNVSLIATRIDKSGKIIDENCQGEEKVKLLKKKEKDFTIDNFYTDSLRDLPLVKEAKKANYVHNGNVEEWDTEKIQKQKDKKKCKFLFFMFLVFYIVIGVLLSYNYDVGSLGDLIFQADIGRVNGDMTNIFGNHHRLSVHPLFVIITQPIYFIISGFTQNKALTLILISSVISASSVVILYKTIRLFCKNEKISMLIAMCYGFTFSSFIFTSITEVYNIAAFSLMLLWYFVAKKLKEGWNKSDFIILVALGTLLPGITLTNYVVFLIACFVLLISKKVSFKKLLLANILVIVLFIGLSYVQDIIWQNTPLVTNISTAKKEKAYMNFSINFTKVKNVIRGCLYNAIVASDIMLKTPRAVMTFKEIKLWNKIIVTVLFLTIGIFTLKNFRKNVFMNIGLCITLLFNIALHTIYGNTDCFLYSMHFMYIVFLIFGINFLDTDEKKINVGITSMLIILLITEFIRNSRSIFTSNKTSSN